MKFLVLWHVFDRQDDSHHIPDKFLSSIEETINCELGELTSKRLKAEKDLKEEFQKQLDEVNPKTRLEKIILAKHEIVLKVHRIVPLKD